MRAGTLDRRIDIQSFTTTVAPDGTREKAWTTTIPNLPARYKAGRGTDVRAADVQDGQADAVFTIRWRGDVGRSQRILYDGETYKIIHPGELGRRDALELSAKILRAGD